MKKVFAVLVGICLAAFCANAQWKVDSFEKGDQYTTVLQLLEADNSMFIYFSLECDIPEHKIISVPRTAYVKAGGLKYKIRNSVNLPIKEDGDRRWAYLLAGHNELNFVLEFEKFPVEDGFDIFCDPEDSDFSFNCHNVQVSRVEEDKMLDTERFLDSAAPVIRGVRSDNGSKFFYYIRDGVFVTYHVGFMDGGFFDTNILFYVDIVNNSDHSIMFDFSKVYAYGEKKKRNGTVEKIPIAKFDPDSYDEYLREVDHDNAVAKTSGVLDDIGHILYREGNHAEYGSWERVGWRALEALNKQAIENRAEEYLKNNPTSHPKALKSQTLQPGESIHGYIATKKKKCDTIFLYTPMDDYEHFYCSVNL